MKAAIAIIFILILTLLLGLGYRYVEIIDWDLLSKPMTFFDSFLAVVTVAFSILTWTNMTDSIRIEELKKSYV